MGRGNYLSSECDEIEYRMVYVDKPLPDDDEDEEDQQDYSWLWYQELIGDIEQALPKSFYREEKWATSDEKSLFRNDLIEVRLMEEDTYIAVILRASDNLYNDYGDELYKIPLARRHLDILAPKVFGALSRLCYDVRVRTSAWTSEEYQP